MSRYFLLIIVIVAISCSQKASMVEEGGVKNYSLKLNEKVTAGKVLITLKEINESRCPVNVNCVRAGEAIAVLDVVDGEREKRIQLCTGLDCSMRGLNEVYLLSADPKCLLKLDSITPDPGTTEHQEEKKVHFTFEQAR